MRISVLDYHHGKESRPWPVFTMAFSKGVFVTGSLNGELKINYQSANYCLNEQKGTILSVKFSKDGVFLAVASDDKTVFLYKIDYETQKQELFKKLDKFKTEVIEICFFNAFFIACDISGIVYIYDGSVFSLIKTFSTSEECKGMCTDPFEGVLVVQMSNKINFYDKNINLIQSKTYNDSIPGVYEGYFARSCFSPNSVVYAVALSFNKNCVSTQILKQGSYDCLYSIVGHVAPSEVVRFFPTHLLYKNKKIDILAISSQDRSISLWNTNEPRPFLLLKDFFNGPILDMQWDGYSLFASAYDSQIKKITFEPEEIGLLLEPDLPKNNDTPSIPFSLKNAEILKNGLDLSKNKKKANPTKIDSRKPRKKLKSKPNNENEYPKNFQMTKSVHTNKLKQKTLSEVLKDENMPKNPIKEITKDTENLKLQVLGDSKALETTDTFPRKALKGDYCVSDTKQNISDSTGFKENDKLGTLLDGSNTIYKKYHSNNKEYCAFDRNMEPEHKEKPILDNFKGQEKAMDRSSHNSEFKFKDTMNTNNLYPSQITKYFKYEKFGKGQKYFVNSNLSYLDFFKKKVTLDDFSVSFSTFTNDRKYDSDEFEKRTRSLLMSNESFLNKDLESRHYNFKKIANSLNLTSFDDFFLCSNISKESNHPYNFKIKKNINLLDRQINKSNAESANTKKNPKKKKLNSHVGNESILERKIDDKNSEEKNKTGNKELIHSDYIDNLQKSHCLKSNPCILNDKILMKDVNHQDKNDCLYVKSNITNELNINCLKISTLSHKENKSENITIPHEKSVYKSMVPEISSEKTNNICNLDQSQSKSFTKKEPLSENNNDLVQKPYTGQNFKKKRRIAPILIEPLVKKESVVVDNTLNNFVLFQRQSSKKTSILMEKILNNFTLSVDIYKIEIENSELGIITVSRHNESYYTLHLPKIIMCLGTEKYLCCVSEYFKSNKVSIYCIKTGCIVLPAMTYINVIKIDILNNNLLIVTSDYDVEVFHLKKLKKIISTKLPSGENLLNINLNKTLFILAKFASSTQIFCKNIGAWFILDENLSSILTNTQDKKQIFNEPFHDRTFQKLEYSFKVFEILRNKKNMYKCAKKLAQISCNMFEIDEISYNILFNIFKSLIKNKILHKSQKLLEKINKNPILHPLVIEILDYITIDASFDK